MYDDKGFLLTSEGLVKFFSPVVKRTVLKFGFARVQAEDLIQDVFIKIIGKAESFEPYRGNAKAWVAAIARNHCLDFTRRADVRHWEAWQSGDIPEDGGLYEVAERLNESCTAVLDKAICLLSEKERAVVMARFYGFTTPKYREVAGELALSPGEVGVLLQRALKKLRCIIGNIGYSQSSFYL